MFIQKAFYCTLQYRCRKPVALFSCKLRVLLLPYFYCYVLLKMSTTVVPLFFLLFCP